MARQGRQVGTKVPAHDGASAKIDVVASAAGRDRYTAVPGRGREMLSVQRDGGRDSQDSICRWLARSTVTKWDMSSVIAMKAVAIGCVWEVGRDERDHDMGSAESDREVGHEERDRRQDET